MTCNHLRKTYGYTSYRDPQDNYFSFISSTSHVQSVSTCFPRIWLQSTPHAFTTMQPIYIRLLEHLRFYFPALMQYCNEKYASN